MAENNKRPLLPRIASYSASDGRSASAFNSEFGGSTSCVGEGTAWAPHAKDGGDGGNPGFGEFDARHCQNATPVRDRAKG